MSDPVVLIGTNTAGRLKVVGLFPTIEDARKAVHLGYAPDGCFYSIMTPAMGETLRTSDGELGSPRPASTSHMHHETEQSD